MSVDTLNDGTLSEGRRLIINAAKVLSEQFQDRINCGRQGKSIEVLLTQSEAIVIRDALIEYKLRLEGKVEWKE